MSAKPTYTYTNVPKSSWKLPALVAASALGFAAAYGVAAGMMPDQENRPAPAATITVDSLFKQASDYISCVQHAAKTETELGSYTLQGEPQNVGGVVRVVHARDFAGDRHVYTALFFREERADVVQFLAQGNKPNYMRVARDPAVNHRFSMCQGASLSR